MGLSGSPGRIQSVRLRRSRSGRPKKGAAAARATATPARSQAELTPLPPNGPHRAHVASPARGSDIWAAIDRRAPDIRPVIRSGIGSVIRPDIWPRIRPHIRSDIWPGIRPHIRPVIWPGVRSGIWSDIRSSVGPDIRPGPIAVAPGSNVGSPAHLLRRSCLRFGIDLCLQIGGTEDQEGSQSENIHAKHLKLLNDSFRLGRPPRSATKTIQSRKGHSGASRGRRSKAGSGSVSCRLSCRLNPADQDIKESRRRQIARSI